MYAGARRAFLAGALLAGGADLVIGLSGSRPDVGPLSVTVVAFVALAAPSALAMALAIWVRALPPGAAAWAALAGWTAISTVIPLLSPPQGLAPWPDLNGARAALVLGVLAAGLLVRYRAWAAGSAAAVWTVGVAAAQMVPSRNADENLRSVVIVTVDGLRYDRATGGLFGSLAAEGLTLDQAVAAAPVAGAAHAAWLTGEGPWSSGHYSDSLPMIGRSVAEDFRAAGYRTAAFVSSELVAPELGFARGFEVYDLEGRLVPGLDHVAAGRALAAAGLWDRPSRRSAPFTVDAVEAWLTGVSEPVFLWIHLEDPVGPYRPGDPWNQRFAANLDPYGGRDELLPFRPLAPEHAGHLDTIHDRQWVEAQYQGEIALVEHHLQRLRRAVPAGAIWIVAGGFGEALGEGQRAFTHGIPQPAEVRVPVFVLTPERTGRYPHPFETNEIGALARDLAGLPGVKPGPWSTILANEPIRPFSRSAAAPDGVWASVHTADRSAWARERGPAVLVDAAGQPGAVLAEEDALARVAAQTARSTPPRGRALSPWQLELVESLGGTPPPP